jgi:outer membrane protein TolC
MKAFTNLVVTFLIIALALVFESSNAQTTKQLTLEFCQQRAVEVYPIVNQKTLYEESAALNIENLDKNYLPQFALSGRASYQSDVTQVPISIPGQEIPVIDKDMFDFYLGLNQLIWDGGINKQQKTLEEANLNISRQQVEVELYKVKERVNGLYFKILLFQQNKELLLSNKKVVADKIEEMESGIRHGTVLNSTADVLKAQVLQIDQRIIEIDTDVDAHYKMLGELLNMDIPVTTSLVLPDPELETSQYKNHRPEYELLNLNQTRLELSKNLVSSSYMPKFSGFGKVGYGKPGLNMLNDGFDSYYYVGVGLSWDIINWNKQKNQKKLLDLQQGIIDTEKEAFDKNIRIQVEDDLAQINKFRQLIDTDEEIILLREKITQTASSQMENGTITSSQYLDELNRETAAKMDLEMHRIQLSFAKINYLKTTGLL